MAARGGIGTTIHVLSVDEHGHENKLPMGPRACGDYPHPASCLPAPVGGESGGSSGSTASMTGDDDNSGGGGPQNATFRCGSPNGAAAPLHEALVGSCEALSVAGGGSFDGATAMDKACADEGHVVAEAPTAGGVSTAATAPANRKQNGGNNTATAVAVAQHEEVEDDDDDHGPLSPGVELCADHCDGASVSSWFRFGSGGGNDAADAASEVPNSLVVQKNQNIASRSRTPDAAALASKRGTTFGSPPGGALPFARSTSLPEGFGGGNDADARQRQAEAGAEAAAEQSWGDWIESNSQQFVNGVSNIFAGEPEEASAAPAARRGGRDGRSVAGVDAGGGNAPPSSLPPPRTAGAAAAKMAADKTELETTRPLVNRTETFYVMPLHNKSSPTYVEPDGRGKPPRHQRSPSSDAASPPASSSAPGPPRRSLSSPPKWATAISHSMSESSAKSSGSSLVLGKAAVSNVTKKISVNRTRSNQSRATKNSAKSNKSGKSSKSGKSNKSGGKTKKRKEGLKSPKKRRGKNSSKHSDSSPRSPDSSAHSRATISPPSSPRDEGVEIPFPPPGAKNAGDGSSGPQSPSSGSSRPATPSSQDDDRDLGLPPLPPKRQSVLAQVPALALAVAAAAPPKKKKEKPKPTPAPVIPKRDYAALHEKLIDALFDEARADAAAAAAGGTDAKMVDATPTKSGTSAERGGVGKSFRKKRHQSQASPSGLGQSNLDGSHRGIRKSIRHKLHPHGTPDGGGKKASAGTIGFGSTTPNALPSVKESPSAELLATAPPPPSLANATGAPDGNTEPAVPLAPRTVGFASPDDADETSQQAGPGAMPKRRRKRGGSVRFGKSFRQKQRDRETANATPPPPLGGVPAAASFDTVQATNVSVTPTTPTKSVVKGGGIFKSPSRRLGGNSKRKVTLPPGVMDGPRSGGAGDASVTSVATNETPTNQAPYGGMGGVLSSVLRLTPIRSIRRLGGDESSREPYSNNGEQSSLAGGSVGSLSNNSLTGDTAATDETTAQPKPPKPGSAASYLDLHCRLQKDSRKGDPVGSAVCATGRSAAVLKLREKVDILADIENGAGGGAVSKAKLKRKVSAAVAARGLPEGVVETRSTLGVKMGLLSMKYGVLLRWNVITGFVETAVLRKMCQETFVTQFPPLSAEASESIRKAAQAEAARLALAAFVENDSSEGSSEGQGAAAAASSSMAGTAAAATKSAAAVNALSFTPDTAGPAPVTPVKGQLKANRRRAPAQSVMPGEVGEEITASVFKRQVSGESGAELRGLEQQRSLAFSRLINGANAIMHRKWAGPNDSNDGDEEGGGPGTEVALLGPPYRVPRPDTFPRPGLSVTVLRARGLRCRTSRGRSCSVNPYVRVSLGEQEHATRPVRRTSNPTWEGRRDSRNACVLKCPVEDTHQGQLGNDDDKTERDDLHLRVEVLDRRRRGLKGRKDRVLGVVFVPLASVEPQKDPSVPNDASSGGNGAIDASSDVAGSSLLSGQSKQRGDGAIMDTAQSAAQSTAAEATEVTIPCRMIQCEDAPYGCVTLSLIHTNAYECWLKEEIRARKAESENAEARGSGKFKVPFM